jgi:hypothetical protein
MKILSIYLIFTLVSVHINSQTIEGRVIDSLTGEPLIYTSIGIINTSIGTITDEEGNFIIKVEGQMPEAIVRISMISFAPQTFTVGELIGKENIIKLIKTPFQIATVVVKPSGKFRKIGNTDYSTKASSCGWGGSEYRKGNEIGLKIALGAYPVKLQSMHVRVHRQAFDSSLYRLHVRSIKNKEPFTELLTGNVLVTLSNEMGWADIDLSKYNIVLQGDIALTLEWIKVFGVNKNRAMKINQDIWTEYVLFNKNKKGGYTYTRWGTEAKWNVLNNGSPSIYLTIQE